MVFPIHTLTKRAILSCSDSLDAVELIMQIEEEFEVEIPDEVASNMKTVKDIVDYIEANK